MDASVLVVGEGEFPANLLKRIRDLSAFHIETAVTLAEADALIQARPPDVLLLQAQLPGSLDLCRRLKQNRGSGWIYCILVDDQLRRAEAALPDWAIEAVSTAEALEAGADTYLFLVADGASDRPDWQQQNRLLDAQVQTGLRRAQTLRDLIRANDLLSTMALSDPLTELSNRRALEWELPRQVKNARVRSLPLSILMLDIDYFKTVNDTYGHLVGDRVLQLLAERLRYNMRFYDTPFRYGGEEFVVILNSTSSGEAILIADRVCRLVNEQPFEVDDELSLQLTVSVGTASLRPEDDEKGIRLLKRADDNLLRAKSEGRNRAVNSVDEL